MADAVNPQVSWADRVAASEPRVIVGQRISSSVSSFEVEHFHPLNFLPDRPRTAFFRITRNDMSVADVFEELKSHGIQAESVQCLQRSPGGQAFITFTSEDVRNKFLRESSFIARASTSGQKVEYVAVYDAPHELPDSAIKKRLSLFGDVYSSRRGRLHGYPNVFNGIRTFRMLVHQSIPSFLRFGRYLVRVKHSSQTPTCRKCNCIGHLAKDCPNVLCFNCEGLGHVSRDCTEARRCSICKDTDHLAVDCPLSWWRRPVHTESADPVLDSTVNTADDISDSVLAQVPTPAASGLVPDSGRPLEDISDSTLAQVVTPVPVSASLFPEDTDSVMALSGDDSLLGFSLPSMTDSSQPLCSSSAPVQTASTMVSSQPSCSSSKLSETAPVQTTESHVDLEADLELSDDDDSPPDSVSSEPPVVEPEWLCPEDFLTHDECNQAGDCFDRLEPLPSRFHQVVVSSIPAELRLLVDSYFENELSKSDFKPYVLDADYGRFFHYTSRVLRRYFAGDHLPLFCYVMDRLCRLRLEFLAPDSQPLLDSPEGNVADDDDDDDDDMGDSVSSTDLVALGAAFKQSVREPVKRLNQRAPAKLPVDEVPAKKATKPARVVSGKKRK